MSVQLQEYEAQSVSASDFADANALLDASAGLGA